MKLIQLKTSNGIILIGVGILGVEIGNKIKFYKTHWWLLFDDSICSLTLRNCPYTGSTEQVLITRLIN